jgi:hypothetical protein
MEQSLYMRVGSNHVVACNSGRFCLAKETIPSSRSVRRAGRQSRVDPHHRSIGISLISTSTSCVLGAYQVQFMQDELGKEL